jgi:predicted CoA-binding protein
MPVEDDENIAEILRHARTIAVVGASDKPYRDSNSIMGYLLSKGYDVIPVNPRLTEVHGRKCYPTVDAIPEGIDIVDVFRNSEAVGEVVEEAIRAHAPVLWMQLGIVNEAAARTAEEHGMTVVMDHCIAVDHRRLIE